MDEPRLTAEDIAAAKKIWAQYQETHDLSDRKGQTAGIDPATGEVWLGEWFTDIVTERRSKGLSSPLFFERVGYPTALWKGRRIRPSAAIESPHRMESESRTPHHRPRQAMFD